MRSRRAVVGLIMLMVVVVYGAISWLFSNRLIGGQFLPPDEDATFAHFGLPNPEPVTVTNGPTQLAGWYFANPRQAGCAAIVLHGFTGNKATVLEPASGLFFERGCDVFLYDLRGHGASSRGLLSYGALDKFDELAAVDWLKQKTGLPEAKIGLWGVSYGAATSLQAAAVRPGLAFVIADASYSSMSDIASVQADKQFGAWANIFVPGALFISGVRGGFDPAQAAPKDAVRGLTTPVLLVHSTTDEFTPSQHSEAIFANSDQQHTRLELTRYGAPHGESFWVDRTAYMAFVDDFLATFAPDFGGRATIVTFEVAGTERFKIELLKPEDIAHARQLLNGEAVSSIPLGKVVRDDPGVNAPWSWHIDPATFEFAFAAIEVCDGLPSFVEDETVTSDTYCPWSAKVVAVEPAQ